MTTVVCDGRILDIPDEDVTLADVRDAFGIEDGILVLEGSRHVVATMGDDVVPFGAPLRLIRNSLSSDNDTILRVMEVGGAALTQSDDHLGAYVPQLPIRSGHSVYARGAYDPFSTPLHMGDRWQHSGPYMAPTEPYTAADCEQSLRPSDDTFEWLGEARKRNTVQPGVV